MKEIDDLIASDQWADLSDQEKKDVSDIIVECFVKQSLLP